MKARIRNLERKTKYIQDEAVIIIDDIANEIIVAPHFNCINSNLAEMIQDFNNEPSKSKLERIIKVLEGTEKV